MTGNECERRTLAQRGPFSVQQCGCGMLHVTVAAVTVRLLPSACEAMSERKGGAANRIGD